MDYKIVALPRDKWKDYPLPIGYTTDEYYDVEIDRAYGRRWQHEKDKM